MSSSAQSRPSIRSAPSAHPAPLSLMRHPYRHLEPVTSGRRQLKARGRAPGSALVWNMARDINEQDAHLAQVRPGGLPLVIILPPAPRVSENTELLTAVERTRPLGILPHHEAPEVEDLKQVLRQPPADLGGEVTGYLRWRGIRPDRDTVHLIRRTLELSAELRSISALSRSLYLSRRALGRRFMRHGLPVPSHWLQFSRLLRVTIRLQNSDKSVLSAGYEVGYPDGFSLSNQMQRLTGYRPTDARKYLGWEWFLEAWLRMEAEAGALSPANAEELLAAGAERGTRAGEGRRAREKKHRAAS